MPSVRTRLINGVFRIAVKRRLAREPIDPVRIAASRRRLDSLGARFSLDETLRRDRDRLGPVPVEWTRGRGRDRPVIYYCHGGAYLVGSPTAYRGLTQHLALACSCDVAAIDYRLAPEHPFPAAPDDAFAGYRALLDTGIVGERIIVVGDSAGGNLALVTLLRIRSSGLAPPAGAVLYSPWADLTGSGASIVDNRRKDPMLPAHRMHEAVALYANSADPAHPELSPVFARLDGLPPLSIHVGSTEILLDDARRVARAARAAGGYAELEIWPRQPHVFPAFAAFLPEGRAAVTRTADFVSRHVGAARALARTA